ncbi:MAG: hypothetical protein M1827_004418 [Pycnora praestabilis]|nr:MAG: hypothetical protein M1827_004418 [Pycnora praestabilis]
MASSNLFPSFLDTSNSVQSNLNQLPRQAPSPNTSNQGLSQQQHPGQINGSAAAAAAAAANGGGMGGLNFFPTNAGHQADLNHLYGQVQELANVLQANRTSTQGIIRSVDELRNRAATDGEEPSLQQVNGALNATTSTSSSSSSPLSTELAAAHAQMTTLESRLSSQTALTQNYEAGLANILSQIRTYAYSHTMHITSLHKDYTQQLATERATNLELRVEHAEWQARLVALAGLIREAKREESEGALGYQSRIAELEGEVKTLRAIAGIYPEDEEAIAPEVEGRAEMGKAPQETSSGS